MTYESEHSAQFAKEAMAFQSMDMDEVLNVRCVLRLFLFWACGCGVVLIQCRWATEDPNPTEKIAEEKRIQEEGQKAISGMLDDNIIEASQTLRALEDGDTEDFYPIEASRDSPSPEPEDARPAKRIRNGESDSNGSGANGGAKQNGLFSADAMDNVRFYAEMARRQVEEDRAAKRAAPPAKPNVTSMLGGYGSGDESD